MCRCRPVPSASIPEHFTLAWRSVLAERFHVSRQAIRPKRECRRGRGTRSQLRSRRSTASLPAEFRSLMGAATTQHPSECHRRLLADTLGHERDGSQAAGHRATRSQQTRCERSGSASARPSPLAIGTLAASATDALVPDVSELAGAAHTKRRQLDRAVCDVASSKAIVSGGADGRLLMGGSRRTCGAARSGTCLIWRVVCQPRACDFLAVGAGLVWGGGRLGGWRSGAVRDVGQPDMRGSGWPQDHGSSWGAAV